MNYAELLNLKTLECESDSKGKHTRYSEEIRMFSCIQNGDISKLIEELKNNSTGVTTGKLSQDNVKHCRYLAVSTITLATRYAIQGGLDEKTAYAFSDRVIMAVDSIENSNEIINRLATEILTLTQMVRKNRLHPRQSPYVKKSISYINENTDKKITVTMLSELCGITPDYLSQIFKEEMGENLSTYITKRKLELSKELIMQKKKNSEIASQLGFSSPSHFITQFKKHYNMTPGEYYNMAKY